MDSALPSIKLPAEDPYTLFLGKEKAFLFSMDPEGSRITNTSESLQSLFEECHRRPEYARRIGIVLENPLYRFLRGIRQMLRGNFGDRSIGLGRGIFTPFVLRKAVRALRRAGFVDIAAYSVAPSLNRPDELRPIQGGEDGRRDEFPLISYLRNLRKRFTAPAFFVAAGTTHDAREHLSGQILDTITREMRGSDAAEPDWVISRVVNSAKDKSLVFAEIGGDPIIVRVPRTEAAEKAERKAYRFLEGLQSNARIAHHIPRPIMEVEVQGQSVFAESTIAGQPLRRVLTPQYRTGYVGEISAFLRALNATLPTTENRQLDGDLLARIVSPMLDPVLQIMDDSSLRRKVRQLFTESLRGAETRVGFIHGDFSVSNIFVKNGKLSGVIDWEDGLNGVPPVIDAFNYLDSVQRHFAQSMNVIDTVSMLKSGTWPVKQEFEFLNEFFRFCGIDLRYREGFSLLYWLYHVGPQLSFAKPGDATQARVGNAIKRFLDQKD